MTIAAVLVAAVSTRIFSGTASVDLRSSVEQLADTFKRARSQAAARNSETAVFLDLKSRTFGMAEGGQVLELPKDLDVRLLTATQELSSDTQGTIRFFPDGTSTGGGVQLARAEQTYTVGINWLTGHVWVAE